MAWPSESSLGGLTLSPMVRWPSTRRRPPAPTVDSTRTSSPRGMTLPNGVATGVSASASGESHLLARRIMSRRRSPSKYSPTNMPSPSARTTVPMSPRDQPTSLRRRSSGLRRSSGSAISRPWNACTCAPGIFSWMSFSAIPGRGQQGREVGGLELEIDVAAVAEAAEQVALRRERLGVGKADQHLFVDEPAQLVDVVRVERAHADAGAERRRRARSSS